MITFIVNLFITAVVVSAAFVAFGSFLEWYEDFREKLREHAKPYFTALWGQSKKK